MPICKRCKGCGRAVVLVKQKEGFYGTEQTVCPECHGKGVVEQTNEEWIKSLNTEELANFLNLIVRVGPYENEPKDFWEHVYGGGGDRGEKSIMEWLKEAHHENN